MSSLTRTVVTIDRKGAVAEAEVKADTSLRFVSALLGGKATILGAFVGDRILLLAEKASMVEADPRQRIPAGALPRSLPPAYGTVVALAVKTPFVPGETPYIVQDLLLSTYWDLVAGRLRTLGAKDKAKVEEPARAKPTAAKTRASPTPTAAKAKPTPVPAPVPTPTVKAPAVKAKTTPSRPPVRAAAVVARQYVRDVIADPARLKEYDDDGYVSAEDSDYSTLPNSSDDE